MKKNILNFLAGVLIASSITYVIMDCKRTELEVNAYVNSCQQFEKGFELGIEYEKAEQTHKELMRRNQ